MGNLKHIGTLYIIIVMLLSCIMIMNCNKSKKLDTITIPEKKGMLLDSLPKEIERDSIFVYQLKDTIIKYTNPIDTVYITKFIKADNPGKIEQYIDAIAEREYSNTVEDSLVKINYHAFTQGRLKDIKLNYTIKESVITLPKPKTNKFSLYLGGGLETKGIIYGSYGIESKSVQVGYMFNVLNIK